jgi:hypothetical protein
MSNIKQILDVPEPTEEQMAAAEEPSQEVLEAASEEELEKMGYMRKIPLFIGSTAAHLNFNEILTFIQEKFTDSFPDVMPVILDVATSKQVEKYIFSKTKELNKIVEFQKLRQSTESTQQVLSAAMRLKSLLGSKPFRLKQCVDKTRHTYKNASDLLILMYVMGFVVRWKVEGEWMYQIISSQADFEAFAKRRIEEAAQLIYEQELYIDQLRALIKFKPDDTQILDNALMGAAPAPAEEVVKVKKPRKKKVSPIIPGEE